MLFNYILFSAWLVPLFALILFFIIRKNPKVYGIWVKFCLVYLLLFIIAQVADISWISSAWNYFSIAFFYFAIANLLFYLIHISKKVWRVLAILGTIFVFFVGFFMGSLGILGVDYFMYDYSYKDFRDLGDGHVYRVTGARMSSNAKPIRVYVDKKIAFLPFLQKEVFNGYYYDYSRRHGPIQVKYYVDMELLVLTAEHSIPNQKAWTKTIKL